MARLQGKTAVITGGNSGMGRATAEAFVREGARVLIAGRNATTLREVKESLGSNVITVECAVDKMSDLDKLAEVAGAEFGSVDIVFANAGAGHGLNVPVLEIDEETFERGLAANLRGKFFTITKLVPLMKNGGSVILTGGIVNHVHVDNCTIMGIVQSSARAIARSMAVELAGRGIRVNCLCPGFISGPAYQDFDVGELDRRYFQRIPLKRMGTGEEVANTVLFLASDESSYLTGTEIVIDGGQTLPV